MANLNYGIIGNGQSAALISENGTIEWCCLPAFDSPSVFGRLLDDKRGGHFGLRIKGRARIAQEYLRHTNVLRTVFRRGADALEVLDFMPRYKGSRDEYYCPPDIIRYIRPLSGAPSIQIDYRPRLGYGHHETETLHQSEYLKSRTMLGAYESLYLYSDLDLDALRNGDSISIREEHFLLVSYNEKIQSPDIGHIRLTFERTKVYWMNWVAESNRLGGPYGKYLERSALVLKLLAYQKTGAVLAAVTTSLPEDPGGGRNWDYRYCWLRDASMVVKIFSLIGHYRVGSRFLQFLLEVVPYKDEKIQIMYGINREKRLTERILPWLDGYEHSEPVRVGNAAYKQKQHDIYGLVMDTIYQRLTDHPDSIPNLEGLWTTVRTLVRHVENNWFKRDAGIWEIRGKKKHFVFSKVLCWVAVDRAIKIAEYLGRPLYLGEWSRLRDSIRQEVMKRGWNARLGAFSQSYGDAHLDASNLLTEHYGFIDASDERYVSTVNLTYEKLCRDGLMYRYRNSDDFGEPQCSFIVCTFWMIKSLHRVGRTPLARTLFEKLLRHTNHLGLLSEDIHFVTKRLLGNFPQAYSHLALIDTALALSGNQESQPAGGL